MVDRNLRTFFRWSTEGGYTIHPRLLTLLRVGAPWKEPTLFHVRQLTEVLRACDAARPHEALMVRLMIGSGVRRAELAGLCTVGPTGLPDLMADLLDHGVAELRVRGEPAPRVCGRVGCRSHLIRKETAANYP